MLPQALLAAAVVEHAAGHRQAALELLEQLEHASRGYSWARGIVAPEASRRAVAVGSPRLAERLLEGAGSGAQRDRHAMASAQAILAEHRGDLDNAAARYADVAEGWSEFGHRLEHGHALFGFGRCGLALGGPDAAEALSAARRLFRELGAAPLTAETDAFLGEATALGS